MGKRVSRIKTEVSEPQMAQAIIEAWRDLFGKPPTKEQVSIILAQNALETGHRKSMYNYNIGNLTTNGKNQYDFYDDLTTDEQVEPGKWVKKNLKYRAYPNLKDGVKDYLNLLRGKGYTSAWKNIVNPNPIAFSKSLKDSGYYTANEKPYTLALTKLFDHFSGTNNYEQALSGKVKPIGNTNVVPLNNMLEEYLKQIAAMENHNNKKMYKKFLPYHSALITVEADSYNNAVEFSRILCLALSEELTALVSIHTNNELVEVECRIPGPEKECFAAVQQLSESLAEVFKDSTHKIGGAVVKTKVFTNKKSSNHLMDLSLAEFEHRKFLLKLA